MPLEYVFTCPLPNGVHARPASALEEAARPFASTISVRNERTGQTANAKSVLGIVAADIRLHDRCVISIAGPDERRALDALTIFLEQQFPRFDDVLPPAEAAAGTAELPRMLEEARAHVLRGTPVVPGIGRGRLVVVGGFAVPATIPQAGVTDPAAETTRIDAAIEALAERYEARIEHAAGIEAAVLRTHRGIARDPAFRERLQAAVRERRATAAGAIADAQAYFTAMLLDNPSALLRERAVDVRDVCQQLLIAIYGDAIKGDAVRLAADSVCVADTLTPSRFLALDRRHLKGLVLAHGGTTSHTVILARSFGIPTLVGVGDIASLQQPAAAPASRVRRRASDAAEAIVDADLGVLVTKLTSPVLRYYDLEQRRLADRRARLRRFVDRPATTADGRRVEVAANIGTAAEAVTAFSSGAEAIGLFRTEFMFLDRDEPPTEDEQFEEYRRVLREADNRPVIIRTLDVGGDKRIPYLALPEEDNPFLGYRAVRLYPAFEALFRAQIAALVRASAFGRLRVMVPMVSRVEEARWVREIVAQEQARCAQAGVAFDKTMAVGAMVEVPSLAFLLDRLAADVDFFSIGTNDLLQYFMAVDRANRSVAHLYDPLNPAFLRLLRTIVAGARAAQRWIGLCGEMGGQPRCLPLLVGLGLDEISMASPAIAATKAHMASLSATSCTALLDEAVGCATSAEVAALLARFEASRPAPLAEPDLVIVDGDARTKTEAIKEIVDRLWVVGRTDRPHHLENAVHRREAMSTTGFGHGFAIPHCKSDAVRANSLVVLKLKTPVEWGSLDGNPVGVVVLLAVRECDQATEHMKVLAGLARRLMDEEFRNRLVREQDPEALCQFLKDTIAA